MSDSFPSDLKYTKDHEWTRATEGGVQVGITSFAVEQLGDITLVNLDVKAGDTLTEGKAFGTIERSEERRVGKECRSRWSPYH